MAYGLALVFEGVTEEQYWAVNAKLGIKADGTGDWPDGMEAHAGVRTADGLMVVEAWASRADQEKFMAGRLHAALAEVGVPAPNHVFDGEIVNRYRASAS